MGDKERAFGGLGGRFGCCTPLQLPQQRSLGPHDPQFTKTTPSPSTAPHRPPPHPPTRCQALRANRVPVVAAVYAEDMYVDFNASLVTASAVKGLRQWVTNECVSPSWLLLLGGKALLAAP